MAGILVVDLSCFPAFLMFTWHYIVMRREVSNVEMANPSLIVRQTVNMGRGVFAVAPIATGTCIAVCQGWLATTDALSDDWHAMQVGDDLWLCSAGDHLDDCINHSCDPNAGFVTSEAALYALRYIAAGEQIGWDYSTSIAEVSWTLECLCGAANCRRIIHSWSELAADQRERLRSIALAYLRDI
jgi:SET domain